MLKVMNVSKSFGAQDLRDEKRKAEKILLGLGFSIDQINRPPSEFSGGYQVRINLAEVLVSEPDLLLLDEPTNYLDVISIRWLAQFLRMWSGELLLITHDRGFMDQVISHTVGIHRKKARKVSGKTEKLYEQIIKEEEIHEKTRLNDDKKRKETEQYINRFRAKARLAGMVQSRIKALEKQEQLVKLEGIKTMEFSFAFKDTPAKYLLNCENITFGYDEKNPLIKELSVSVGIHDRIAVIGKNGKGKTTLLKLLVNELKGQTGVITGHHQTTDGYYVQTNTINLNHNFTIEEELMAQGCERQKARDIAGSMMFEGDNALKKISVLSGGEKSRVLLGKILVSPCNLLILDEPTNHLDMELKKIKTAKPP
jgi:ATP-binding cassette subfamily F protein 3